MQLTYIVVSVLISSVKAQDRPSFAKICEIMDEMPTVLGKKDLKMLGWKGYDHSA
jgi:hypothetical protein